MNGIGVDEHARLTRLYSPQFVDMCLFRTCMNPIAANPRQGQAGPAERPPGTLNRPPERARTLELKEIGS
jgi:hypothetical protein